MHRSPVLRSGVFCIRRKREEGRRKREEELFIFRVRERKKFLNPDSQIITHAPAKRFNQVNAKCQRKRYLTILSISVCR
ncbi:hypothetical protein QUB13_22720 [Microcoleus sp. B4-D4]